MGESWYPRKSRRSCIQSIYYYPIIKHYETGLVPDQNNPSPFPKPEWTLFMQREIYR